VIPDKPIPTQFKIYQVEDGVCIDNKSMGVLVANIRALAEYADEMRKILEGLQK